MNAKLNCKFPATLPGVQWRLIVPCTKPIKQAVDASKQKETQGEPGGAEY
jgi:hypothetical protein